MLYIHEKPVQFSEHGLSVKAYMDGHLVGQVKSLDKENGSVLLGDIEVQESVLLRNGFLDRIMRSIHPGWGIAFPRKHGIGSELLKRFIGLCERQGVRQIFGNVTPEADLGQPFLRKWYESHGFVISPPDGRDECCPVKYKVIWNR